MSIEEQPFATVIVQLFKDKPSLDINGDYGKGLPINPYKYMKKSCHLCDDFGDHDDHCEYVSLTNPRYAFGIGPGDGDYGVLLWTPKTSTLEREGHRQWRKERKIYDATTPAKKVLKDIKKMCIASGPQYSDEDRFPADAFVVIPRMATE